MRNDTFYTNTIVRKKRGKITSLPVRSLPVTWLPVMSHPLDMLIPAMSNGTFRTTTMVKKKRECTSGHVQNILPVMTSLPVTWFHVTSFPFRATSGHVISSNAYPMARSPLLPRNMPWAVSIYYFDIWIWGTLRLTHEKYIKDGKVLADLRFQSNILHGSLTDLCAWVGFRTSSPQQGVKYQHWYLKKTIIFSFVEGVSINIPWKIYKRRQSSCPLGVSIKAIGRAFNWLKCLGGFPHLKPTAGCQISTLIFEKNIVVGDLYKYPIQNISKTAKFLPSWGFVQRYCPGR